MAETVASGTALMRMSDLPDGATREFILGGGDWPPSGFLVRMGHQVHAYLNRCPHALRPLNFLPDRFLTPDGGLIQCTAHGALFEKDTGLCIAGPCVDDSLRRIAVRVVDDSICLDEDLDLAKLERWPR
ncbi:MAG TPA: Rieske 2Fe-2S domain-containing protein [Steroidobacteraceae bacterium]|nr:Rieske 2Fe-2S domain-containing protein [Steroidobacteraceae bacterium]